MFLAYTSSLGCYQLWRREVELDWSRYRGYSDGVKTATFMICSLKSAISCRIRNGTGREPYCSRDDNI